MDSEVKASRASVSIIVPTLNEVENLDELLNRVFANVGDADSSIEVLIADGGSTDGTQDKALAWSRLHPVRLIPGKGHGGLSGDVLNAARQSTAEIVVVMDADLSHPPEKVSELIAPLISGTHDMAIGCRYMPGGGTPGWPLHRRLTSRIAGSLAWPLVGVRDSMSGFFAVRRELMLSLGAQATGFKIGLEILARGGDELRTCEIPITFVDRVEGESKMSAGEAIGCFKQMLALAGGNSTVGNAMRFGAVGLMGLGVDLAVFNMLLMLGFRVEPSHILSFLCATVFNYLLNARWAFKAAVGQGGLSGASRYARFLAVCMLALFLRGAVLESFIVSGSLSARLAIYPAIAVAMVVNYIGFAFFVFRDTGSRTTPEIRWRVLAMAVVGYSIALRLAFVGIVDLLPEEAYYWNYAQHLDIGYLDHPPMVSWLIWLSTGIFGNNEFAVRIPAMISWLIAGAFLYRLGVNLFGMTVAFRTVMLFSILPIYFSMGFLMMPDAPLYAAWAGCLYFLERALLRGRRWSWIGFGVCLGLGMLSKYSMALIAPATLAFILLDPKSRRWLVRPQPYLGALVAAALFSPVIVWNAQNEWASFLFQGTRRWAGEAEFSLHLLIGAAIACLTPIGVAGVLQAMLPRRFGGPGLNITSDAASRVRWFSLVFTLVPLAVFVLHSLQDNPKIHWTGPVWLGALPLLAYAKVARPAIKLSRVSQIGQRLWKPVVVGLMLFFGGGLYAITVGPPATPRLAHMELPVAWEEMNEAIEDISLDHARPSGARPFVIGLHDYFITSQNAFYQPSDDATPSVAGRGLLGYNGLMWDQWRPPGDAIGRDAVVVDFVPDKLLSQRLELYFERVGDLRKAPVIKNGAVAGHFFYRIGYGYTQKKTDVLVVSRQ